MVELRRNIKCSNCNTETSFYLTSDLALNELLVHGRCQRCGNSLQINFSIIDSSSPMQTSAQASTTDLSAELPGVNLDSSLFEPEITSESIQDLIED